MSLQLVVGSKWKLAELKGKWLSHNNNGGFQVQVSQNVATPKARYFGVCYTAPKTGWKSSGEDVCKAHIKAIGPSRDEMTITSVNLTHICGTDKASRKRNYCTRDVADVSDVLEMYQPTTGGGNTKQFMTMAKTATGFSVKKGQAARAVKSRSQDSVQAHIGQFFWIPSLFHTYAEEDPTGTYCYESVPCFWTSDSNELTQF